MLERRLLQRDGGPWFNSRLAHNSGGVAQLVRALHLLGNQRMERSGCSSPPASKYSVPNTTSINQKTKLVGKVVAGARPAGAIRYKKSVTASSSVEERPVSIAKLDEAWFDSTLADRQPGRDSLPDQGNLVQEGETGLNFPTVLRHCLVSRRITAEASVVLVAEPARVAQIEERQDPNPEDVACNAHPMHFPLVAQMEQSDYDRMRRAEALQLGE